MQAITYLFFMSGLDRLPIVAKNIKISTDQFFAPKISTKNARFTTSLNLRQNSVNVFKIKYFSATGSTGTCVNSTGATSTGATSTGAITTGAITTGAISTGPISTGAISTGATSTRASVL